MKNTLTVIIMILFVLTGCTNSGEHEGCSNEYKEAVTTEVPAIPTAILNTVSPDRSEEIIAGTGAVKTVMPPEISREGMPEGSLNQTNKNAEITPTRNTIEEIFELPRTSPTEEVVEEVAEETGSGPEIKAVYAENALSGIVEVPDKGLPVTNEVQESPKSPPADPVGILQVPADEDVEIRPELHGKKADPPAAASDVPEKEPTGVEETEIIAAAPPVSLEMPTKEFLAGTDILPAAEETEPRVGTSREDISVKPRPAGIERIALLPLENLTEKAGFLKQINTVLTYHLEKKGVEVVHGSSLDDYICEQRIRSAGLVPEELAHKLRDKFDVTAIMTGSVISFSSEKTPKLGILMRLIDSSSGRIRWAGYAYATGDDFSTILGLGRISSIYSLIPRVIGDLLKSLSAEKLNEEMGSLPKVALMPFKNNSDFKYAGKIAMYMFMVELLKNQRFEPIEYGNTRNRIIKLRIRQRGELDFDSIKKLSEPLGADAVLIGVVDGYSKETEMLSSSEVAITARLINSSKNRIVWYNTHRLRGEDKGITLNWGTAGAVHNLAYNVVIRMVKDMGLAQRLN